MASFGSKWPRHLTRRAVYTDLSHAATARVLDAPCAFSETLQIFALILLANNKFNRKIALSPQAFGPAAAASLVDTPRPAAAQAAPDRRSRARSAAVRAGRPGPALLAETGRRPPPASEEYLKVKIPFLL